MYIDLSGLWIYSTLLLLTTSNEVWERRSKEGDQETYLVRRLGREVCTVPLVSLLSLGEFRYHLLALIFAEPRLVWRRFSLNISKRKETSNYTIHLIHSFKATISIYTKTFPFQFHLHPSIIYDISRSPYFARALKQHITQSPRVCQVTSIPLSL